MGFSYPDTFLANLTMTNIGTNSMYLAYKSSGNTIAGTLTVNNIGTGIITKVGLSSGTSSSLTVNGACTITNDASSSDPSIYLGDYGDITFNSSLTLNNITSNTTNSGFISLGNRNSSNIIVSGSTSISNSGSGTANRIYLGNQGDVTFDGTLAITNNI